MSTPKYIMVHTALRGQANGSVKQLSTSLEMSETQVMGALAQLQKMGAASRPSRGVWVAGELPTGFPKTRGRPVTDSSLRGKILALLANGSATLSDITSNLASDEDDKKAVRTRTAHTLVGLMKEAKVEHIGTRGKYRYMLAEEVVAVEDGIKTV